MYFSMKDCYFEYFWYAFLAREILHELTTQPAKTLKNYHRRSEFLLNRHSKCNAIHIKIHSTTPLFLQFYWLQILNSNSLALFFVPLNPHQFIVRCCINPAGKIAEKAVWRSAFWTIWHCVLNTDSTKTHSSSVTS